MTLAEGTPTTAAPAAQATPPFEIDILDPRFYDDPWEAYRWLRTNAPLWWDARNEMWVVSRHEDVSHISRHQELYSAAQGVRPKVAAPMSIISMDDPEHTRQRRLVNKGFTPRMVRQLADHIRELSNEIIDEIADKGECDFVEDFAIHVPLIVIAELMGLDPDQRQKLYRWSDAMMAGDGHLDPEDPVLVAAAEAGGEFAMTCVELIEQRRVDGTTDDIIGILTQAFDEGALSQGGGGAGDELTHDELIMFLILLVVAGNETTRNALSGGLVAFTRFPDQHRKLLDDPGLIDLAVDEIVRYVSPVMSFMRTVTEDHSYQGVDLEGGRPGVHALPVGEPRRDGVRRPRRVPRRPRSEPAPGLRHRHPLLPRRQPRPGRDRRRVHRAVRPAARHPRRRPRHDAPRRLEPRAGAQQAACGVHARESRA